jgi:branched-subunit amino acid transport protein
MVVNIIFAIIVTSLATYSSRFFGVLTSEKINEKSKIYRWFNCLAYSTLAALISRILIFPNGALDETSYFMRLIVIFSSILIFYVTKKNLGYPMLFSDIILSILHNYIG